MRLGILTCAAVLVFGNCALAQEKPLGDVARDARKERSQSPHAKMVFTNEESSPKTVVASDDPVEVVHSALTALVQDRSHRCRLESSGNSGPGHAKVIVGEVAGPDRSHLVVTETRPERKQDEWILIGDEGFYRRGSGAWQVIDAANFKLAANMYIPQELMFSYEHGGPKFVGSEEIDGAPTLHYQYTVRDQVLNRIVNYWIGIHDNLPRKTDMWSSEKLGSTEPISWQETFACSYGVNIKIVRPI